MDLTTFLGGLVATLLSVLMGLLAWFSNKVWDRLDRHETQISDLSQAVEILTSLSSRQEKFFEDVIRQLANVKH